jgi:hypothetical protein
LQAGQRFIKRLLSDFFEPNFSVPKGAVINFRAFYLPGAKREIIAGEITTPSS